MDGFVAAMFELQRPDSDLPLLPRWWGHCRWKLATWIFTKYIKYLTYVVRRHTIE